MSPGYFKPKRPGLIDQFPVTLGNGGKETEDCGGTEASMKFFISPSDKDIKGTE